MTRVGMCPSCRATIALDDKRKRLVQHERVTGSIWRGSSVERIGQPCAGSGKRSVADRAEARSRRHAAELRKIDKLRADARVALDAVIEGRDEYDAMLPTLIAAALKEYRLRNVKARNTEPWKLVSRTGPAGGNVGRVDLFCLFCGELIRGDVDRLALQYVRARLVPPDSALRAVIDRHTTPCALQCLAGMRPYAAPGTRRLPGEVSQ